MWSCSPHNMGILGGPLVIMGMIAFLVALYFVIKAATKKEPPGNQERDRFDSLGILKTRLAKGEISIEEFNNLKRFL